MQGSLNQKELPEAISYLLMKEKFDNLYRNIERMSNGESPPRKERPAREAREALSGSAEPVFKAIHLS
jgi:hypothetical protein